MSYILYLQHREQGRWANTGPLAQVARLDGVELTAALENLAGAALTSTLTLGYMRGARVVFLDHAGATVRLWQNHYQARQDWLETQLIVENKESSKC